MSISLTIPMESKALLAAATMLQSLADDTVQAVGVPSEALRNDEASVSAVAEAVKTAIAHTMEGFEPVAPVVTVTPVPEEHKIEVEATIPAPAEVFQASAQDEPLVSPTGVEVDASGLPWDARIHASSKAFLARPKGTWKKKRNLDPALLASVEAELRATMAVPSPTAATPAPPVMEVPTETGTPTPPPAPTPEPVTAKGEIDTFPKLIQAITANGIDTEKVNAACKSAGLQALPLLAARPDLVGTVAHLLGL